MSGNKNQIEATKEQISQALVDFLDDDSHGGVIEDSRSWAADLATSVHKKVDHSVVIGCLMSLQALNIVDNATKSVTHPVLTAEGNQVLQNGSPEWLLHHALAGGEKREAELLTALGWDSKTFSHALGQGMKNRWLVVRKVALASPEEEEKEVLGEEKDKEVDEGKGKGKGKGKRQGKGKGKPKGKFEQFLSQAEAIEKKDTTRDLLKTLQGGTTIAAADLNTLKRRKLVGLESVKYFRVSRGEKFTREWQNLKQETDLTTELLANDRWKSRTFKPYNFSAKGQQVTGGHLHPLMKVRAELRQIFLELGYEEMPTNNFVESSFWNFDSLFQPQSHPARDAHDTFFVSHPQNAHSIPEDYMQRVCKMHEEGDNESIGWRSVWREEEARKNLLRTHTTAVSARMLYKLAQQKDFKPAKYFSIDRVYRNETLDATHLAEFHQVEGLIADYDLSLSHLIAVVKEFFQRMGIPEVRMHSCYNPYTEPSMEIFGYHPTLEKWVELGNSGMFRPEMLLPMGLPPGVRVIAWGLSLERPTMIKYEINNIRNLLGHRVPITSIAHSPICQFNVANDEEQGNGSAVEAT